MSIRLRELIQAVRNCKTQAEEREVISKEAALIRTSFGKGDNDNRTRNLAKLLYMNILGHPTHWGQIECVKSIASPQFVDKRIGYLALNLLLDENQEVLMLATHSMKVDLYNTNQYIAGLALVTIGNIASEQICRDCAPEVEQLLGHNDPYIQKKAALCALKMVRKVPDLADQFKPKIKGLLEVKDGGVLVTAASLMIGICQADEQFKATVREKFIPSILKILKTLAQSGYLVPEYEVGNVTDPFLQVKLLRLLRIVGGSKDHHDKLNEVLAMILTNTDSHHSAGSAVLYECVNTIMAIDCESELRVMAVNILGKFLANKDNNIRYVALCTLGKVVDVDTEAVQRHRGTIVDCLKDPDMSIRRRALHLIYSLVDASNVRILVRDLINFLMVADTELRAELTAKLCYVTERFAPSTQWFVDSMLKILTISGEHVPEEVRSNFVAVIGRNESLHAYVVHKVFAAFEKDITLPGLNHVAIWCLGEYGDLLVSQIPDGSSQVSPDMVIDLLEKVLKTGSDVTTKKYAINALVKLSVRIGDQAAYRIPSIIAPFQNSLNVDLQQRACEYLQVSGLDKNSRQNLLQRLPPLPVRTEEEKTNGKSDNLLVSGPLIDSLLEAPTTTPSTTDSLLSLLSPPPTSNAPENKQPVNPINDILNLFATQPTNPNPTLSGNGLESLFAAPGPSPLNLNPTPLPFVNPTPAPVDTLGLGFALNPVVPNLPPSDPQFPPIVALSNQEIKVTFYFKKPNPQTPQYTLISAVIANNTDFPVHDLNFLAAPPNYIKYALDPAPNSIDPRREIVQPIKAANAMQGQKPLVMKLRITYSLNQQQREMEGVVKNFPQDL